jgi:hypothetical protein
MTIVASPPEQPIVADPQLLFREARQRRRRRWLVVGIVTVLLITGMTVLTVVIGGGHGLASRPTTLSPSGDVVVPSAPLSNAHASTATPVALGNGPTDINFIDANHGWIATGCISYCYESNPHIVRTTNGGSSWSDVSPPNMAGAIASASVWFQYGGVVKVHFTTATRGWYLQAGELWSTNDGGTKWSLSQLGGIVTAFASSGNRMWALVDSCGPFPCASFHLYYRSTSDSSWRRSAMTMSSGSGSSSGSRLVAYDHTAYLSVPGHTYSAITSGPLRTVDLACLPVGSLERGRLIGLCNVDGGGDASVSSFSMSNDYGRHWLHLVDGPPSTGWSGAVRTNGDNKLFYITGGAELWRFDAAPRSWDRVLQTAPDTTDEIYPIYFAGTTTGFAGESGSSGTRLLATHDAGLTWSQVRIP